MQSMRFYHGSLRKMQTNPEAFSRADIDAYVKAYSHPGAIKGGLAYYRASFAEIIALKSMNVPNIQCPVLMLWGEQDKALGKELTLNTEQYCNNTLKIVYDPGSGHFIQLDNPELVNKELLAFFSEA